MTDKTTKPDTRGKGAGSNNGGVVHRKDSDFMDYAQAISEEMPIFEQHKNRKDPEDKKIYFGQNPVMLVAIERLLEIITDPKTQRDEKELSLAILCALGGTNRNDTTIRTPYIFIDVDPPKNKKHLPAYIPAETLAKLEGAPYTPMLYKVSYSCTGIHLIYKVTEEVLHKYPHGSIWAAMRAYLKSLGIAIDEKCKDATRLCFLNYDPDAKLDKSARLIGMPFMAKWEQPETPKTPKVQPSGSARPTRRDADGRAEVERLYRRLLTDAEAFDEGVFEDGSRNSRTNLLAKDCRERGISYAVAIDEAKRLIEGSGYTGAEIEAVFRSVYEHIEVAPPSDYYRIAGIYYKRVDNELKRWQLQEVKRDLGKGWEAMITTLDGGYANHPDNLNFQQVIGNRWNLAQQPPAYEVRTTHCNTIISFIEHLTALSWEADYLLDYMQIMWQNPFQKLPILVFTSAIQGTGKSAFFELLRLMLGGSVYVGSIRDITGRFTSSWVHSQCICLEESTTNQKAQNDELKYLATTKVIRYEAKGVDFSTVPFFAKLMLANNEEQQPLFIQGTDQRYVVLRVQPLAKFDPDFESKVSEELGFFMNWLTYERQLSTTKQSRLWFEQSIIETTHTKAAKEASRPDAEVCIAEMMNEVQTQHPNLGEVYILLGTLKEYANSRKYDFKHSELLAALRRMGEQRRVRNPKLLTRTWGADDLECWTFEKCGYSRDVWRLRYTTPKEK